MDDDEAESVDGTAQPPSVVASIEVPEPGARGRADLRGWVYAWMFGIDKQGKRTLDPQSDELAQIEAYFFAIALRQLFRSVQSAIRHADKDGDGQRLKDLRAARDAFDKSVPHACAGLRS